MSTDQTLCSESRVACPQLSSPLRGSKNRTRGNHIETAFLNTSLALSRLHAHFGFSSPGFTPLLTLDTYLVVPETLAAVKTRLCVINTDLRLNSRV